MAHMLMFQPWGIVLTNIEEDHLDFYRDIAHIHETFQEYVGKLPHGGLLVRNADDARCMSLTTSAKAISFSAYANHADYRAENHSVKNAQQFFAITTGSHTYNDMTLRIPGTFNIANALGAAAMALEVGVKPETIRDVLAQFRGIWRRFETLGEFNGAPLISDYGHHPTAVAETVKAAKSFYPEKKIVLAFQPHHQNRTKKLFTEFVESFDGADTVLLQEIYDVAGREDASQKISSSQLVEAIRERDIKNHKNRTLAFMENRDQIESWLRANASASDVVLLMGAGEIYKVGHSLIKNN
jgi:UDP-N-acetylmuramate--alanine ligase